MSFAGIPGGKVSSILHYADSCRCSKDLAWGHHLLEAGPDCTHSALESAPSPRVPPALLAGFSNPLNVAQGDPVSSLWQACAGCSWKGFLGLERGCGNDCNT